MSKKIWLRIGCICAVYVQLVNVESLSSGPSQGNCREEQSAYRRDTALVRHLNKECTESERLARSISAVEIHEALAQGKTIDLSGVIIQGDLALETLPTRPLDQARDSLSADDRLHLAQRSVTSIRLVSGGVTIRDTVVRGRISNRTNTAPFVVAGPVILSGTTFQESVDLSKAVFFGIVDCSSTRFSKEGYFVQARFVQPALFTAASFGPHTRFHRAVFSSSANFSHTRFNGLAEFLEVSFQAGASFVGASFASGTGFSGSRFEGPADFSHARFAGDLYFLFTQFERNAQFQGATFQAIADFSDANFGQGHDLQQADFSQPPHLPASTKAIPAGSSPAAWVARHGATALFLLLSLILVVFLIKMK